MQLSRRLSGLAHGLSFGVAMYASLLVAFVAVLPVLWHRRAAAWVVQTLAGLVVPFSMWCGRIRVIGRGRERAVALGRSGGYILIANHSSNLDPMALIRVLGRTDLAFVAKAETLRMPLFGPIIRAVGWFGVERDSLLALKRFKEEVEARKKTGWVPNLVIFPEGTRSIDGRLQPFKIGPFLLAVQTGLPILPVVIRGASRIHPRNAFMVHPGTVRVDVCEPIHPPADKVKAAQWVDVAGELMRRAEAIYRAVPDLTSSADELPVAAGHPSPHGAS